MNRYAKLSHDFRHRFLLGRDWRAPGSTSSPVLWIMLNPSTADAEKDDATIRRCVSFSKAFGFEALEVANLFGYRATKPKDLMPAIRLLGDYEVRGNPQNAEELDEAVKRAQLVIYAWGDQKLLWDSEGRRAIDDVKFVLRHHGKIPMCLGTTKSGMPKHPVRLPNGLNPIPWSAP